MTGTCEARGVRRPASSLVLISLGGAAAGAAWALGLRQAAGGPAVAVLWALLVAAGIVKAGALLARCAERQAGPSVPRPRRAARHLLLALIWGAGLLAVAVGLHRTLGVTGMYKPLRLVLEPEVAALYVVALPVHAGFVLWTETRADRDALRRGAVVALAVGGGAAWLAQDLLGKVGL